MNGGGGGAALHRCHDLRDGKEKEEEVNLEWFIYVPKLSFH